MTLLNFKKSALILFLTSTLWACSGGSDAPTETIDVQDKNRKDMLTNLADNIIIPSYASFQAKFDLMLAKRTAFLVKPEQLELVALRQAWADAYVEWQKVELFEFGPGEKYSIRNYFNIYPANVAGINSDISELIPNFEVPASYDRQGFPALDYMINGVGADDAAILAYYGAPTEGAKRLAHLNRLTNRMGGLINKVRADWSSTARETFVNKTGLDIGSSSSLMVNAYVLHYERYIRSGKFGIPSGAMLNGIPAAEKVEGFYKKDLSLTLAKTAQQAFVDFFNGKNFTTGVEGASLKTYLNALGAKDSATGKTLSEILNTQFEVIKTKLNALKPNLYDEVKSNNQAMKDTYTEMQKAVRMLKVDMTSAMSITITYTDNDGD
ncbi:imelysin family protein [Dyadobacter frigoris]|uniref:Peptidase M75, Imelysin n=1 Tax=Dyadobacter frigoris TaxID=2576211 RepID=A0A4U6D8M3_9BACT|nr:imelysin family protein [Dyadobacter frigoris]TKT92448.1 peptidase M75, Imelysin [Dyadobacter frigoris]GLU53641.1 iron-regulated protein A precursor [Dyadobacter frigoris]